MKERISAEIEITYDESQVVIKNDSDFVLEMHLVPVKPRRKVFCEMVMHPNQFRAFDHYDFNISDYYFRFVEDK